MKIQILDRYVKADDWHEIYVNGEILFEGELDAITLVQKLLNWLAEKEGVEIETRFITPAYEYDGVGDYEPPLHSMTGENYWSDWEKASDNLFDNS